MGTNSARSILQISVNPMSVNGVKRCDPNRLTDIPLLVVAPSVDTNWQNCAFTGIACFTWFYYTNIAASTLGMLCQYSILVFLLFQ